MKIEKPKLPAELAPYSGIIYFMLILTVSHFAWKYTVLGDEQDILVSFFGLDISAPFVWMSKFVANSAQILLHAFGSTVTLDSNNTLKYENGHAVRVIWACSGIKQAYIYICIIAFYRGSWKKKSWYIPLGIIIICLFNILRISIIAAINSQYPHWFNFLHEHFFKYLFYGLIFGMWVIWEEKITIKKIQ